MGARSLPRNVAGILSGRQSTVPEGPGEPSEVSKTRRRKADCHHLSHICRVSHNPVGACRRLQYVYRTQLWLNALLVALLCRKGTQVGYAPVANLRGYSQKLGTNPKTWPDQMRIARVTPTVSSFSHPQTHGISFSPRNR